MMIGIFFALTAALSWGGGDFLGGLAARKLNPFQVLLLTTAGSLSMLVLFALLWNDGLPSSRDILIAVVAGICGALGLTALYRGLTLGNTALVAPVAGVVGVILPMTVGIAKQGLPTTLQLFGFGLAILGIWLVSWSSGKHNSGKRSGLSLALLAGLGFGAFLALIAQLEGEQVFTPLVFSKLASILLAWALVRINRNPLPDPRQSPVALLSGCLDAGGNILYLFATQFTRLDIAAILSSLYPAGTVVLSILFLKESVSSRQWIGVLACLTAIILITV
jgi:drug/metabolite transporter (DMT)-like permease